MHGTEQPALRPNRTHINQHLFALFEPAFVKDYPEGQIEIAYASPATDDDGPNRCENFSAFEIEKAADFAERKNQAGFNVYVGAALRDGKSRGRAAKENVETGSRTWSDFDAAEDAARVSDLLREKNVIPSEMVITGTTPHRRFQIYIKLAGKVTPDQLEYANTVLRDWLGGDDVQRHAKPDAPGWHYQLPEACKDRTRLYHRARDAAHQLERAELHRQAIGRVMRWPRAERRDAPDR
jgi:hypothetical protein